MTTMTNVSKTKNRKPMRTLDKMWESMTQEQDDVMMDDMEAKIVNETTHHNSRNSTTDLQPANDDNENEKAVAEGITHYEFAIRIKIKAMNKDEAHQQHKQLLSTIQREYQHFRLYSKSNNIVEISEATSNHFQYNEVGKHRKYYIVVHGIELECPYHKIKQNENIFQSLKHNNCYIQQHVWPENEWNIVTIGFLSGISPKHQSKEMTKRNLINTDKNPPKYELAAAHIKTTMNGVSFTTFAYEVKCIQKDTEAVCDYLTEVGKSNDVALLKHKWKHTNSDVYINGIHKQNELLQNIRTIPIYGIDDATMNSLYDTLISKEKIINVAATNKTTEYGRWNVYTLMENFGSTTEWLQNNLKQMYSKCRKDHMISSEVPKHFVQEVKFNTTISFPPTTKDPHLESATSSVRKYNSSPTHSWASVVSGYSTYKGSSSKTNSPATSIISSTSDFTKTLQHITTSMERICERLEKIEARLDNHDQELQQTRKFHEDAQSNMDKLANLIAMLEERTTRMAPRRLDHSFELMEPNKRQDTRRSPSKGSERD